MHFGGEKGMEKVHGGSPPISSLRGMTGRSAPIALTHSWRDFYGIDLFLGATLQMDYLGNSSTGDERQALRIRRSAEYGS